MAKVIGYVFDQAGERYKDKYYFEGTAEKIGKFIIQNSKYKVTITDLMDCMICSTCAYSMSDFVFDQELIHLLLPHLLDIQKGNFTPISFEEVEPGILEEIME